MDPDGNIHVGTRYRIRQSSEKLIWLCGLYRMEEGVPSFVVLTREPGEEVRFLHDRMPFILPEGRIADWISPDSAPEDLLPEAVTEMIVEKDA